MRTRRFWMATALILWAARGPTYAQDQQQPSLTMLQEWLHAVERHEPGVGDQPALLVGSWSRDDLELLFPYLATFIDLLPDPRAARVERRAPGLSDDGLALLRGLAAESTKRGGANRVLQRGALLHADVVMLPQGEPSRRAAPATNLRRSQGGPASLSRRFHVIVKDGQPQGVLLAGAHWEFARTLLDSVQPSPSTDSMTRLFYSATLAHQADNYMLGDFVAHLRRAQQLFPADAEVLLDAGCLHETFATPRVQSVVEAAQAPGRMRLAVESASGNLHDAERFFRRALAINPGMTEALVRLGRVRSLQGRHEDAVGELQRAVAAAEDPALLYLANLFLGDAERALGRREAARVSYERAAAILPRAQSAHLAISSLARAAGDRSAALRAMEGLFTLPAEEADRHDPWWSYHKGRGRNVEALFAALRAPFLSERAR